MPELPEVETIRSQLSEVLVGKTLVDIEVRKEKVFEGDKNMVVGRRTLGVGRRGKVLVIDLQGGVCMAVHLKMSGQLVYDGYEWQSLNAKEPAEAGGPGWDWRNRIVGGHPTGDFVGQLPSSHTRVIFYFESGVLYFNDQRMFGWVKVVAKEELDLEKLGPEPWEMREEDFVNKLSATRRPVKVVIMDQAVISGVGNIYANDALWEAEIRPQTPSNKLSPDRARLLFSKLKLVLEEGIKYGGATMVDAKYVNLQGLGGRYQEHFRTYAREGQPCERCGGVIVKGILGGRGTYWCPVCQR